MLEQGSRALAALLYPDEPGSLFGTKPRFHPRGDFPEPGSRSHGRGNELGERYYKLVSVFDFPVQN